jgi:glycosyltransferase involved in cell wall biosynthesis
LIELALLCDYLEEGWPSMDLVGEMIIRCLQAEHADQLAPTVIRPPFSHRAGILAPARWQKAARNADRLLNRFWDYPRQLRQIVRRSQFDLFHLVDHSYSQLVHALPPDRVVVTCHDLDTFRCLLEPKLEPRPSWFRAMARQILRGLQKAAAVACDSEATRRHILAHGLLPESKLHVVYLAIYPECQAEPTPEFDAEAARLLGPREPEGPPEVLHIGSNIPRKRIDVLLKTFAGIRRALPRVRLIKVGGAFTAEQAALRDELGIGEAITILPFFSPRDHRDRATLAAVYRRADLVLQPSDAEGFGLPVAEAMACGTPVLASDLAVLREVGGQAAMYAPVADVPAWTEAALALLDERQNRPEAWQKRRDLGKAQAGQFSWSAHTNKLVEIYKTLAASSL